MTDDLDTIEPLHPAILKAYKGLIQGDTAQGVDLEFDTLHYATSWARTCGIEDRVFLQDNAGRRGFACTISITYYPKQEKS